MPSSLITKAGDDNIYLHFIILNFLKIFFGRYFFLAQVNENTLTPNTKLQTDCTGTRVSSYRIQTHYLIYNIYAIYQEPTDMWLYSCN